MKEPAEKFFWGAATSSHQVEGGNINDWTEWEKAHAKGWAEKAESKRKDERFRNIFLELVDPKNYISGVAADHYHKFKEDFDIARNLGHNAHRFSIEWSRIEPEEGKFNDVELDHYREVVGALKERGIEPFVTLYHWTVPLWFRDQGGWLSRKAPEQFTRYVEKIVSALPDVRFWVTLNEPNVYSAHSYMVGDWPPGKKGVLNYFRVNKSLISAHKKSYGVIKKLSPGSQVGIAQNVVYFEASGLINKFLCWFPEKFWNWHVIDKAGDFQDFICINYYFHNKVKLGFNKNDNKSTSDIGWEIYPDGLYYVLKAAYKRYKKPVYITENGIADMLDEKRASFIRAHVAAMQKAAADGVDVRGYFYWSLLDNFEWGWGFAPRFGLVEVDHRSQERHIRQSAWEYKKIIEK